MGPLEFLFLVTWTPPFVGMMLLAVLGFIAGIGTPLENAPEWVSKLLIFVGVSVVSGLLFVAQIPLVAIPLGLGFVGYFIGTYFRLKAVFT